MLCFQELIYFFAKESIDFFVFFQYEMFEHLSLEISLPTTITKKEANLLNPQRKLLLVQISNGLLEN